MYSLTALEIKIKTSEDPTPLQALGSLSQLPQLGSHTVFSLHACLSQIPPFCKDISHMGVGSTPLQYDFL